MSLFDDDFFSTRVSRKARSGTGSGWGAGPGPSWNGAFGPRRRLGTVQLAFLSSFVSALAAVLIFGLAFGFGGEDGDGSRPAAAGFAGLDQNERVIKAAAKVRPAVVSIINEQMLPEFGSGIGEEGGEDPMAPEEDGSEGEGSGAEEVVPGEEGGTLQEASLGSGVIIGKQGGKARIVTNFHVVDGAYSLKAVLVDGTVRDAQVVGKDQITDLAILEIDAKGIETVAEIGDSSKLRDGETVLAIGNPLGLSDSLTAGIVSKTSRVIPVSLNQDGVIDWEQEVIQTDASINQGNSGGALVNLDGQLVGINSMKVAEYGVEGVGFAIPIDNAVPIMNSLVKYGKVPRPYLGVYTMDLSMYLAQQKAGGFGGFGNFGGEDGSSKENGSDGGSGAEEGDGGGAEGGDGAEAEEAEQPDLKLPKGIDTGVIVLEAVGPAKEAGLAFNDVIVRLDQQPVGSTMELRKYLYTKKKIGDSITVTFYREGKKKTASFELEEKKDE